MKIYAVGGAIRDELLKREVYERDWAVVGGSAEQLIAKGYKPVGKDFPVFLHPKTREQYALARTERKVGPGYHGFSFDTSTEVTLEEDLGRRDLTINAMARDSNGKIIDPYGGQIDLEKRVLRHVSPAFAEDPLRILRVARFAARFNKIGFTVAKETEKLMRKMVSAGEADSLKPDRVWQETEKALSGPTPEIYFKVLRDCSALSTVFPEINALFGIPQPEKWHPEVDTGIHTLMALSIAACVTDSVAVRFATLTHHLGKATTPKDILPKHHGHEERSVEILESFCSRLPIPKRYRELAVAVAQQHGKAHRVKELKSNTIYKLLESLDALRRPERFEEFILACEADARGRTGFENRQYSQADVLRTALNAARKVRAKDLGEIEQGPDLGETLRKYRVKAIHDALAKNKLV
jgi:tRNA nucleotidyltransferase (CCA-adding enzyme)